jgi:hypothetical protein
MTIAVRILMLATLLGVATAAGLPFGTPGGTPDCSVANRPQLAFPGAYVNVSNVRESEAPCLPSFLTGRVAHPPYIRITCLKSMHACLPLRLL